MVEVEMAGTQVTHAVNDTDDFGAFVVRQRKYVYGSCVSASLPLFDGVTLYKCR